MKFLFFASLLTALSYVHASEKNIELIEHWLEIESQKGKLQLAWQSNEQALKNQLVLLNQEKASLKKLLKNANAARSEVDAKRLALTEQQVKFESNQTTIQKALEKTYLFANRIAPLLPPPIQQDWQSKLNTYQQTSLSNSEKLEKLLSVFKSADEFNQRIAINNTSMTIPSNNGSDELLVNQMYLGLSYAWYISKNNQSVGVGRVEQTGWQWYHGNDALQLVGEQSQEQLRDKLLEIQNMLEKPTNAFFIQAPLAIAPIKKELL